MSADSNTDLRYPIGRYQPQPYSVEQRNIWLNDIKTLPQILESAVTLLTEEQLNSPYRPEGWTIKQLVHHMADSHMNAYIRFKLGLTEDLPVIKPYKEKLWAMLRDSERISPEVSITLIRSLHARWFEVIAELSEEEWGRVVFHPEQQKEITLWNMLGLYAWHGRHHVAHIAGAKFDKQ